MFRPLDPSFLAAPQIGADDVATAAAQGVTTIVNNRPDGEEPSAPQGEEIAAAAAAHGLAYVAIPITHSGFSYSQIDALAAAIEASTGPILAYCRSGTRSTNLWALTRARMGDDSQSLCDKAAAQGYDLSGLRPTLDALAAGAA
jgi:uncharacterized protein (TIGR01244 family)